MAQGDGGILRSAGEHQTNRPPDGHATPHHNNLRTIQFNAVTTQQVDRAVRGARQRGRLIENELAQVHRVQAIGVLLWVDEPEDAVLVEVLRQRQLHDVAGARRVLVEVANYGLEVFLSGVRRQVAPDGGDTDLLAIAVLHLDVGVGPRVVAD